MGQVKKKRFKKEVLPGKKVQLSFTLRKGLNDRFLTYCKDNMINKSQLIESFIIKFFDDKDFAGMKRHE